MGLPGRQRICLPMQEMQVLPLGWEDPLEKEMAAHFSVLAGKIPWAEEPGGLQSMGVAKESDMSEHAGDLMTFMIWKDRSGHIVGKVKKEHLGAKRPIRRLLLSSR